MKLWIATPSHSGKVTVTFAWSLADTLQALQSAKIAVRWNVILYCSFPHAARDKLVRDFLKSDYTDILFIDDDMGWEVGGLLQMLLSDVDVVGAICPKRSDKPVWAVNLLSDANGQRIEKDGLLEAAWVGTAIMRIRRSVFERMPDRYFNAGFEPDGGFIGEDAWFCREWRRLGGQVWADPRMSVIHSGQKDWHGNYSESVWPPSRDGSQAGCSRPASPDTV